MRGERCEGKVGLGWGGGGERAGARGWREKNVKERNMVLHFVAKFANVQCVVKIL